MATNPQPAAELTTAEVAKKVKRRIVVEDGGASRTITKPIAPEEILSWRDYGTHLVVVTIDGQKHTNAADAA